MTSPKRNFHDLSDEDEGSDREDVSGEDSRFAAIKVKRRRLDAEEQSEEDLADPVDENAQSDVQPSEGEEVAEHQEHQADAKMPGNTEAQVSQRKERKAGVIYISRVPPFMTPARLRTLLSPYGDLGRVFLTPESKPVHLRRVRAGGSKKKSFVDGWVEFSSKKKAKVCVQMLNGQTIGGKKGGFYYDDIWNLKYLKGFKWTDLMEQVQVEERMREGRLRAELQREARERKTFLNNMETTRRVAARDRRTKNSAQPLSSDPGADPQESHKRTASTLQYPHVQHFKQKEVMMRSKSKVADSETVQRVLRNIF